jgi:hypothetical protein
MEDPMAEPDDHDRAPGAGDPTKSDDTATPGHNMSVAGSTLPGQLSGPSPSATAGGGYGSTVDSGQAGDTPDGDDVQETAGPGPQTDWLRGAAGMSDRETDDLGR